MDVCDFFVSCQSILYFNSCTQSFLSKANGLQYLEKQPKNELTVFDRQKKPNKKKKNFFQNMIIFVITNSRFNSFLTSKSFLKRSQKTTTAALKKIQWICYIFDIILSMFFFDIIFSILYFWCFFSSYLVLFANLLMQQPEEKVKRLNKVLE